MNPTAAHTADIIEHIEQLTARLRILEPILRRRASDTTFDGYPRQSGPAQGPGHGDPVGATVVLRVDQPHRDLLSSTYHDITRKLDQARRLLEQAESAGRQALPPPPRPILDDGCRSCARIRTWSPISRSGRCRWCSDWAYAHNGDDPPADILRAHHEGRRITTRIVETISIRRRR